MIERERERELEAFIKISIVEGEHMFHWKKIH